MMLSDLIVRLQSLQRQHGDMEVRAAHSSQRVPSAEVAVLTPNGKRYANWHEGESMQGRKIIKVG